MKPKILLTAAVLFTSPTVLSEPLSFQRSLSLDANQLQQAQIIAGQGDLTIVGLENSDQITVHAQVISNQYPNMTEFEAVFAERVMFSVRAEGGAAQIMAKARYSMHNTPRIQMHLTVEMPNRLSLLLDDGSGDIRIQRLNSGLEIDDQSGAMVITDSAGAVQIKDDHGPITLQSINGNVRIKDKDGDIELVNINGNVQIKDKDGEVLVNGVSGDLRIDDGDGDIRVAGLAGQFTLEGDDEGSVSVNGIDPR